MTEVNFDFGGRSFTAAPAEWQTNGEDVWDIFDEEENFFDSFTVKPFEPVMDCILRWKGSLLRAA